MSIKSYKSFNFIFFIIVYSSLFSIGILNMLIDPYDIFNIPKISGFNKEKPSRQNHIRLIKAIDVARIKPKIIILGSSTALRLSPKHPALADNQPVYNLGLTGAGMEEELLYFQYALKNQPDLKQVIISVDFFSFGVGVKKAPDFVADRLNINRISTQDAINTTLSLNAINSSWRTIITNINSKSDVADSLDPEQNRDNSQNNSQNNSKKANLLNNFKAVIYSYFQKEDRYKNYKISQDRLNDLKTLLEICKRHNIEVKIFFSPTHAMQMEALQVGGLWSAYQQWQREIVKITPIWDFTGYSQINTEPINREMKNFVDGPHYQYLVADLIINRIYQYQVENVPSDFGILVTPETIEAHLNKINFEQKKWQADNGAITKIVTDLYTKANR
jgi:hypothetical protein